MTQLQQLADLCYVSHFAAVCTIFALNCAVSPHIGNVYLICLCDLQDDVVCWYLFMQASEIYYYYSIARRSHFETLRVLATPTFPLCLVFLHALTDGHLRFVFLHPLDVFSPVTIFVFNLPQP